MENIDNLIADGWVLSEFSRWISLKDKKNFFNMLGNENCVVVTQEESRPHRKWKARVLISPLGVQILNLYFMPVCGNA